MAGSCRRSRRGRISTMSRGWCGGRSTRPVWRSARSTRSRPRLGLASSAGSWSARWRGRGSPGPPASPMSRSAHSGGARAHRAASLTMSRFRTSCCSCPGGHSQLLVCLGVGRFVQLGTTRDDAAGEAFDKAAKLLGLAQPGGPAIERAARDGDPGRFKLPRPLQGRGGCDFSFSVLKTAMRASGSRPRRRSPPAMSPTSPPPTSARSTRRSPTAPSTPSPG